MSSIEFTEAAATLLFGTNVRYSNVFAMGGTPLNEAVIAAMDIVPEFQKKYKLQVVNTVFLTDGDGDYTERYYTHNSYGNEISYRPYSHENTMMVTDPVTMHQEHIEKMNDSKTQVTAFVNLLKARTHCNVIGFYILNTRDLTSYLSKNHNVGPLVVSKIKAEFVKEKHCVITNGGFDEYYLLNSTALKNIDSEFDFETKSTTTTRGLVSAFTKYTGGRVRNRVVLNRFIGMISGEKHANPI
jgi:hypothetical protein